MPIGLFLGIVLALGRLYHESEMTAMTACGVGPLRIYKPVALLAVVVAALLAVLSLRVIPAAWVKSAELRVEATRAAQFGALEPGRFRSFAGGEAVFYAERVEKSGELFGVFVQRTDGDRVEIAMAERAVQRGAGQPEQMFVLYDGRRYEGVPGTPNWRIVEFREHGIPVRLPDARVGQGRVETRSTASLLASDEPKDRAELAWRIAVPVMALVLTVLAVPLARLRPRQGRFARVGYAVVAYFLYSNLLAAVRVWIQKESPGGDLGMWWVHLLPLLLAAWLLWRELHPGRTWRLALAATAQTRGRGGLRRVMGVLGRYVVRTVLAYTLLVMLVLLALGALFMFIGQQDDIGVGDYTATQALLFVALNLPSYLFQLLPIAALIGSLLGLGNLARGSELVVMRASGVTTARFCAWLGSAGVLLAALMFLIGEYVAPPLGQYARQMKVFAKFDEYSLAGSRATWVRDGNTIISVDQQSGSARFGGIKVFQLDPSRRLLAVGRAESASVPGDKVWRLENYRRHDLCRGRHGRPGAGGAARRADFAVVRVPRPRGRRTGNDGHARPARLHRAPPAQRTAVGDVSRRRSGRASRASSQCCW